MPNISSCRITTLGIVLTLVGMLGMPTIAMSAAFSPSSMVAWTVDTLNLVRSGDPVKGAQLNRQLECDTCHGDRGESINDTWPSLSGQPAGYTFKILKDYQDKKLSGTSQGHLMAYIVEEMSDQDMVDVASYFAQQKLPTARASSVDNTAKVLDLLGDPDRLIPPCGACHGMNGEGEFPDTPALAGQSPKYLIRALNDFKLKRRHNDVYSRMRLIAAQLSDAEIAHLATYYSNMGYVAND